MDDQGRMDDHELDDHELDDHKLDDQGHRFEQKAVGSGANEGLVTCEKF